ncbi:MAG: ABC transporter ATP-binding protein [bacterium]|nr:ABC transporter ATP-binding protein [bacterium]MDD5756208.1 ABC transporter ATP-binding protein [bacterium]
MAYLEISKIQFAYRKAMVLKDISFTVHQGDFLGIIGPNGSGKSTLLKILARLLKAREGTVALNDLDLKQYPIRTLAQKIALVPEETLLNFPFTVEELVLMGRSPHLPFLQPLAPKDHAKANDCMEKTSVRDLAGRRINELSSGERQRAFIAQALAQEPDILLLDEPTAHLDINHQIEIFNVLKNLQEQYGLTIITITHDLNLAALYCDTLLLLKGGELFSLGPPSQVLTAENIKNVYHTQVTVQQHQKIKKLQITLIPNH